MSRLRSLIPLFLIAALALPAAAQFSFLGLKNSLVDFVLDQISVPGELEITAEGVEDAEDGSTEIVGLNVADARGVWLSVERLSLNWEPSRILRGDLVINRLAATGVEVLRAPNASAVDVEVKEDSELAQTDDEPFDWPRSPITTHIRSMELIRVAIAPGLAPDLPGIAFDAHGALRDEGDEQSLRLEITRSDSVSGRIKLDYIRNFETNRLDLSLTATEDAGGMVAALAGLPNDSASRFDLAAAGPLTDWDVKLDGAIDHVLAAKGAGLLDATGRLSAKAELTVTPGEELAQTFGPAVAAALTPEARLRFDMAEDENGLVTIREGLIDAGDFDLSARGTYDRRESVADLDLSLKGGPGLAALAEGVEFDGFGFAGALKGPLDDLSAEGRVSLDNLRTAAADIGAADLAAKIGVQGEEITLDVDGGLSGFRLDRLDPALLGEVELAINGVYAGDKATLTALRLAATPLTVEASGAVDLAGESADLSYAISAPRLGPLAGAYDVAAEGALRASGRVSGPFALPRLTGEAALEGMRHEGEDWGAVRLTHDATFGETPEGEAAIRADGPRYGRIAFDGGFHLAGDVLTLRDLIATGLGAKLAGAAEVDLATSLARGDLSIDAPDLSPLERLTGRPAAGAVRGKIALAREGGKQNAALDLDISDIEAADMRLRAARIDLKVKDALGALAMDLTGDFQAADLGMAVIASGRLSVSGDMAAMDVETTLSGVTGEVGMTEAALKARITDALGAPGAEGTLEAKGIAGFGLALDALSVKGSGRNLSAEAPAFDIAADLSGADLGGAQVRRTRIEAKGDLADIVAAIRAEGIVAEGAGAGSLNIDARIREATGADPAISAKAALSAADFGAGRLERTTLTAEGRLSALALDLKADGALAATDEPLGIAAAAKADLADAAGPQAELSRFTLSAGEAELALNAPLRIISAGETTRFSGIDLGLPGGALTGDAALHAGGFSGDLSLDAPDLKPVAKLADLPISAGALRLDAKFDTRAGSAGADIGVSASDLRFAGAVADIGALALQADLDWNGRQAEAKATLSGPFAQPLRLAVAAPLRASGGPVPTAPRNGALSGSVDWAGRIGDLWALVPAPGHVLDGDARVALRLSGTMAEPVVGGDIGLSDGRYENFDAGTILTDIEMTSNVDSGGAFIVDVTAKDGAAGMVTAKASLSDGALDAAVTANNATLVRRDDVTAALSIDLKAAGPLDGPDISGKVNIDRAEVRLVAATPPGVADIGKVRIKGEPVEPEPEPAGGDIALNIDVTGPTNIFVRGRGLDSEWSVALQIRGTAAEPRIAGAIEKRRGVLNFLGRVFELDPGSIRFTGGKEIDPTLDIKLLRENDGVTGGIAVSGTALDPDVSFTSTPSLPEEEVLPRVLFGRSKQSLTPGEALTLATGLATLMDGSGGTVDSVRGAVGLDVLRFDEDSEGNANVTVGTNITNDVFVGAKQPIDGGPGSVVVEIEVFNDVHVNSEVGPAAGTSLGVKWKKDF
ncbi:MAG: translocation/assembly module TamB domain-containing protein [Pikeienuella sp.]